MQDSGKTNYKSDFYKGLGHLIDLPFSPATTISNHAMFPKPYVLVMGGTNLIAHGRSQEKIWTDLKQFFLQNLT